RYEQYRRGQEKNQTVAMRDLTEPRMIPLVCRFTGNVGPPADHGIGDADHSNAEDIWRGREHVVHPCNAPDCRNEGGDCPDRGPRARCHQMIVMMRLGVSFGHLRLLHLCVRRRCSRHSFLLVSFALARALRRCLLAASQPAAPDTWCTTG